MRTCLAFIEDHQNRRIAFAHLPRYARVAMLVAPISTSTPRGGRPQGQCPREGTLNRWSSTAVRCRHPNDLAVSSTTRRPPARGRCAVLPAPFDRHTPRMIKHTLADTTIRDPSADGDWLTIVVYTQLRLAVTSPATYAPVDYHRPNVRIPIRVRLGFLSPARIIARD